MEKVIYVLERKASTSAENLGTVLRSALTNQLLESGALGVQVNIDDQAVAPAADVLFVNSDPYPAGMVSVWVPSAIGHLRALFDKAVAEITIGLISSWAAYLVTESEPLPNTRHPAAPGERTHGLAQVAFLTRPSRLDHASWLAIWHDSHTQVALDTQDTFGYVQNVVVRPLTDEAPNYDAIVEELFPVEAMTDRQSFFDAAGDPEKFERNFATMMESLARFLDFDKMDVIPSSRYVMAPVRT